MAQPKRHHWWPVVQSKHWIAPDELVTVTKADGSQFRANPINIGVESELYTRFGEDDTKDVSIEEWFAETIDSPAKAMMEHIFDSSNYQKKSAIYDPTRKNEARQLGFLIRDYSETMSLPREIRISIARYIAALLVRNPFYLEKLIRFHANQLLNKKKNKIDALDNMLHLFDIYKEKILHAEIMLIKKECSSEFLWSDGGLIVVEPWQDALGIPFDIHMPLTPDISIEILPYPGDHSQKPAMVSECNNQGVSRFNKIILSGAKRFVFSRGIPPREFILKNFGINAPKDVMLWKDPRGNIHAKHDSLSSHR